jgi:heterodisulfide reductase subunit A-like polyferredoxin
MLLCVGPAERFCSRICCTTALKNAIELKRQLPNTNITILYRDIRAYGFKERLYTQARQLGVLFVRYDPDRLPEVDSQAGEVLKIRVWDRTVERNIELQPDLLVLSMPVVPGEDARRLSTLFKVPVDADGFFMEAHVKLRPVDFSTDGIFMAGMAHYPKLLDESIIQAQAAAGRAARVLSQDTLVAGGRVAVVEPEKCTGCLTWCELPVQCHKSGSTGWAGIIGAAYIEAAICQGCGSCVAECPARAIQLMHYTDIQMAVSKRLAPSDHDVSQPGKWTNTLRLEDETMEQPEPGE